MWINFQTEEATAVTFAKGLENGERRLDQANTSIRLLKYCKVRLILVLNVHFQG